MVSGTAEARSTWGEGGDGQAFLHEAIGEGGEYFCKSTH